MEFKDYYKILGVEDSADNKAIKTAYRKLARKYHPDVSEEHDAENRFKEVELEIADGRDEMGEARKDIEQIKTDAVVVKKATDKAMGEGLQEVKVDMIEGFDRIDKRHTASLENQKQLQQRIMNLQEIEDTRGSPAFELKKHLHARGRYFANIENGIGQKDEIPQVTGDLAEHMTKSAQDIAESFAKQADCDAMIEQLTRDPQKPDKMSFDEENFDKKIDTLRYQLMSGFLVDLAQEIHVYNTEPNDAQMTTRSRLLNKMRKTIETSLTKYEQVELVADSCLQSASLNSSKTRFRTICNSCNMPLARKRMVADGPSEVRGPSSELRTALRDQVMFFNFLGILYYITCSYRTYIFDLSFVTGLS